MVLSYGELAHAVLRGVISDVPDEHVNAASIDVTLGPILLVESPRGGVVSPLARRGPALMPVDLREAGAYDLAPGEWCLAQTAETFNLPNDLAGEFRLKSSGARCGLQQALAVWCDPGWNGSVLTLELSNSLRHHRIRLEAGMPIGQIILHRCSPVPASRSYSARGRYNGDVAAQAVKP